MDNKEKALRIIEGLCLASDGTLPKSPLRLIYKMAHVGIGECRHPDWEAEMNEIYDKLKKDKVI